MVSRGSNCGASYGWRELGMGDLLGCIADKLDVFGRWTVEFGVEGWKLRAEGKEEICQWMTQGRAVNGLV